MLFLIVFQVVMDPSNGFSNVAEKPPPPQVGLCVICQKLAMFKCSRCRSTFYCGKEHHAVDWMNHQKTKCKVTKISSVVVKTITAFMHTLAEYQLMFFQIFRFTKKCYLSNYKD